MLGPSMSCSGDGTCFQDCLCMCYNPETDEDHLECTCGHRVHDLRYCRKSPCPFNCVFVKCKNFNVCGTTMPKWDMMTHPGGALGLCFSCWAYNGELKETSQSEECPICREDKILVQLKCHSTHKVCMDCWNKTIDSKAPPSTCPMCRTSIGGWKFPSKKS